MHVNETFHLIEDETYPRFQSHATMGTSQVIMPGKKKKET